MNKTEGKLKQLARNSDSSSWKETVAYRKANKEWLKKSTKIALRVLDVLEEKGWSQAKLAKELDVSPQQVSKLVKGKNDFKLSTVTKLEGILQIPLVAILQEDEVVIKRRTKEILEKQIVNTTTSINYWGNKILPSTHRSEKIHLKVA